MNKRLALALGAALLGLPACAHQTGAKIGLVDVPRIVNNWPKFMNYQNQLNSDVATIQQNHASNEEKQRELEEVQRRFAEDQAELTNDVADAAKQVAADKHLTSVFTREYVGYGGVDITADVEKILHITETK